MRPCAQAKDELNGSGPDPSDQPKPRQACSGTSNVPLEVSQRPDNTHVGPGDCSSSFIVIILKAVVGLNTLYQGLFLLGNRTSHVTSSSSASIGKLLLVTQSSFAVNTCLSQVMQAVFSSFEPSSNKATPSIRILTFLILALNSLRRRTVSCRSIGTGIPHFQLFTAAGARQ